MLQMVIIFFSFGQSRLVCKFETCIERPSGSFQLRERKFAISNSLLDGLSEGLSVKTTVVKS